MTATAAQIPCQCRNYADAVTGERLVCNRTTTRKFAPGHDARLKGFLIKVGRANHGVRVAGVDEEMDARQAASGFGFYAQVLRGINRTAPAPKPATVTAKVGRWFYEGTVSADGSTFSYTDRRGNELRTAKFAVRN